MCIDRAARVEQLDTRIGTDEGDLPSSAHGTTGPATHAMNDENDPAEAEREQSEDHGDQREEALRHERRQEGEQDLASAQRREEHRTDKLVCSRRQPGLAAAAGEARWRPSLVEPFYAQFIG